MNLTLEEFLHAVRQVNPELDVSGVDEGTDIHTGIGLDSLQMMLLLVVLGEEFDIDPKRAAAAQTVADFCEIAVRK